MKTLDKETKQEIVLQSAFGLLAMAVTFAFVAWTALSYAMMSVACDFFIAFLVCSMLSFLFLGFLGLIPFAGLFFRQWTKTKQKWRIDYAFFGFLMSVIYFTRFLQGVLMYWI